MGPGGLSKDRRGTQTTGSRAGLYSLHRLDQNAPLAKIGQQAVQLSSFATAVETAIIPTDALQLFLERLAWTSPLLKDFPYLKLHLNLDQPDQLQAIAQSIQANIEETPLPQVWSQAWTNDLQAWINLGNQPLYLQPSLVLPSACDSGLMGIADLIRPQYCWLQPDSIAKGVKHLWQQLFQAPILYLWEHAGLPFEQLGLAVMVQPLESVAATGWLSLTPAELFVQAMPGLYQGLGQGEGRPDQFQVNRYTGKVRTQQGHYSCVSCLSEQPQTTIVEQQPWKTGQGLALTDLALQTLATFAHQLDSLTADTLAFRWSIANELAPCIQICEVAAESPWPWIDLATQEASSAETLVSGQPATAGCAIAPALVTQTLQTCPLESVVNRIVVVHHCQPSDLPWLQQAAGLICETGGLTSHAAILARELGLPSVMGFVEATALIETGQLLRLDGDCGAVYTVSDPSPVVAQTPSPSQRYGPLFPLKTQVWITLSQFKDADRASQLPVDGVGLLRSEWLLLDLLQRHHPQQWIEQGKQDRLAEILVQHLQIFLRAFAPRPIFYRTFDGSTRELADLEGGDIEPLEVNPALGLRGVARYQADPRLFDCELAALAQLQRRGWDQLRLLLPFVRSVQEFEWCCDRIATAGLLNDPSFEVWIMAEVPSVLFLLEDYVKAGVQGIAIGASDFTQLILGADRDCPDLNASFNINHPAVMAALSQLIQAAKTLNIPCSLCGPVPVQSPQWLAKLVNWGITAISVEMQAVSLIRHALAEAELSLASQMKGEPLLTGKD